MPLLQTIAVSILVISNLGLSCSILLTCVSLRVQWSVYGKMPLRAIPTDTCQPIQGRQAVCWSTIPLCRKNGGLYASWCGSSGKYGWVMQRAGDICDVGGSHGSSAVLWGRGRSKTQKHQHLFPVSCLHSHFSAGGLVRCEGLQYWLTDELCVISSRIQEMKARELGGSCAQKNWQFPNTEWA